MPTKKHQPSEFLMYKNKPLVRCGDTIYYGNMYDEYVVQLQIKHKIPCHGLEIADKVSVKLISTNLELSPQKQVIKFAEKPGLYSAIDIADIWLSRAIDA